MLSLLEASALSRPAERSERKGLVARLRANLQRVYVWGLLARSGDSLAREAPALAAVLARAPQEPLFLRTIPWQQAALVAAACGRDPDAVWVAAQIGLSLRHAGASDSWAVRFQTRRRVRSAAWVSPPLEDVDTASLDDLEARGWTRLPEIAAGDRVLWLVPRELAEVCPVEAVGWKAGDTIVECVEALAQALDIVARAAPEYLEWITDGIHTIVPVDSPPGASTSMSFQYVDGAVVIGLPADAATLGELLVHEASHVILNLVEPVAALSNGRDGRQYHSPFARADRDIRRILVGFHAFANIAAYYQRVGGPAAQAWLTRWWPALEVCCRALTASPGVTPHGRALFEPIAGAIGL